MHVEVVLTPAEVAQLSQSNLHDATCVVFDVLRATSTMLTALANGARRVFPVLSVEEAFALRNSELSEALLGGERHGFKIDGFDLGNSPREYEAGVVGGKDIISTTTNGTVALRACVGAARVYAGALINLEAQAKAILGQMPPPARLILVCAGTGEDFALEDGLAAAALLARLPTAEVAGDAPLLLKALLAQSGPDFLAAMLGSSNGARLARIGLVEDVTYCARISVLDAVAVLVDRSLRLAGAGD